MAQLKNTDKIWNLENGQSISVGHNRTITLICDVFHCSLHGHTIAQVRPGNDSGIARMLLNTCGYATPTTRAAMEDFARAFGCQLSVSFAKGKMGIRFKNGAGHYVERDCDIDRVNGAYAMGRYI